MFCASRLGTECDGCSRCHPSLPLLIPESDVTAERNSEKQKKIMRLSQRSGGINPPTRLLVCSPRQMPVSSCIVGNQLVTTGTQIDGNESNAVYIPCKAAGRRKFCNIFIKAMAVVVCCFVVAIARGAEGSNGPSVPFSCANATLLPLPPPPTDSSRSLFERAGGVSRPSFYVALNKSSTKEAKIGD